MSAWTGPLWKQQLAALWLGALVLGGLLVALHFRESPNGFWLIPYPTWRSVYPTALTLLRAAPLAAALIGVPIAAAALTLSICTCRASS